MTVSTESVVEAVAFGIAGSYAATIGALYQGCDPVFRGSPDQLAEIAVFFFLAPYFWVAVAGTAALQLGARRLFGDRAARFTFAAILVAAAPAAASISAAAGVHGLAGACVI